MCERDPIEIYLMRQQNYKIFELINVVAKRVRLDQIKLDFFYGRCSPAERMPSRDTQKQIHWIARCSFVRFYSCKVVDPILWSIHMDEIEID